jgi:hypothetical protein
MQLLIVIGPSVTPLAKRERKRAVNVKCSLFLMSIIGQKPGWCAHVPDFLTFCTASRSPDSCPRRLSSRKGFGQRLRSIDWQPIVLREQLFITTVSTPLLRNQILKGYTSNGFSDCSIELTIYGDVGATETQSAARVISV